MGSGKTTVGRILSEALGYSFVDRLVILLSLGLSPELVCYDWKETVWEMVSR